AVTIAREATETAAMLRTGLNDISKLREAIQDAQKDSDRASLLNWLSCVDPSSNFNSARDKHQAGTGDWLLRSNVFRRWKTVENSLMWLNEKPGSGKSVLSSTVIHHLEYVRKQDPTVALAYFYFTFNEKEKQTTRGMITSFIKQLCYCCPDIPEAVQELSNYQTQGHTPDLETLEKTLLVTMDGFSSVLLLVDALDECPFQNNERKKLLLSHRRIHRQSPSNLHLLCTSRREEDIEAVIKPLLPSGSLFDCPENSDDFDVELSAWKISMDSDIGILVEKALASEDFRIWPEDSKQEAERMLFKNADGM
ncbi:uncharacterized protein LY89DRAFT_767578, partial [Mollisia scopiformis]